MLKPDLCYGRDNKQCLPSWSGTDVYLTPEHQRIWEMTKEIEGWQHQGDSYKLYEMAYHCGDVILEIGTYCGKSAVVEILGARANPHRRRVRWFGVDLAESAIRRTRQTLLKWKLHKHCKLFQGDAQAFFKKHPISPTMVFVDGDHSYEGVKRDIEALSKVLSRDVPVLFHDFRNRSTKGIPLACTEWEQTGQVQFLGCFGGSGLFVTVTGATAAEPRSFWERFKAAFAG